MSYYNGIGKPLTRKDLNKATKAMKATNLLRKDVAEKGWRELIKTYLKTVASPKQMKKTRKAIR